MTTVGTLRENGSMFVTGGAGFIGSHLVDRLVQGDCTVTVFDSLAGGANWIQPYIERGRVRFVQANLLDRKRLEEAMRGASVVWHLGGNTDIPAGFQYTDLDVKNAILATHSVLESMRLTGVAKLLFPSTGAVYGEAQVVPTPESYGPLLPLSLYAAGKLACEALISAYCSMFGLRARILRLGNVVGARMGHGVIYDFIEKLSRNPQALEILGDGRGEKNYFLVEECIDGMVFVLENTFSDDDPRCDILNLGTDASTPVMTIARIVIEEMGLKNVRFRYTGGALGWPGDQPRVCLDVTKLKNWGWTARHPSDHAVRVAARRYLGKG